MHDSLFLADGASTLTDTAILIGSDRSIRVDLLCFRPLPETAKVLTPSRRRLAESTVWMGSKTAHRAWGIDGRGAAAGSRGHHNHRTHCPWLPSRMSNFNRDCSMLWPCVSLSCAFRIISALCEHISSANSQRWMPYGVL